MITDYYYYPARFEWRRGEVGSGRGPGSLTFAQPRAFAIGMENTKELSHKWRDMETCCISPHPSNEKTDTLVSDEYLIRRGIFLQTLLLIHFSGTHLHIPRAECVLHWKESPRRIRKLSPYSIAMPCRRIFQLIRVWLNVFTNTFSRCGCTYVLLSRRTWLKIQSTETRDNNFGGYMSTV